MSTHPFDLHPPLDKKTRDAIAETKAIPHGMPSRPISSVRALWLCRASGCSWWTSPDLTHCRSCGTVRSDV